ncbi:MAG: hypothetical protein ACXU84_12645 [Xanthobacteraceae bacterium]
MKHLEERVQACEQENARLRKQLSRQNSLWMTALLLVAGGGAIASGSVKQAISDSIKAREIVVVDANGTVRARLGGDLPDAIMANGRVAKRGSKAAGLMIYDEQGIERGGYVTQDTGSNAMLTLDSKSRQAALLVAGPDEDQASALRLWTKGSSIEMRSDENGSRLSIADINGVTYQQPALGLSMETCVEYKKLEQQYPGKRICQSRFTESACSACFAQP